MRGVAGIFHVPAWDNSIVIGLDRDLVFSMVELLFGGDGSEPPIDEERGFSNIELQIAQSLIEHAAQAFQAAFAPVASLRLRLERIETRMDFVSVGRRATPSVVARFLLQAINRGGEMFMVVPQLALSPLRQALAKPPSGEPRQPDPAWAQKIGDEVQRTEVRIRAVLESQGFTLADIAALKVGQVLQLQATPRSRVKVESSEQPLFWAYLGQNDGYHTLCIDEPINQEREFMKDVLSR
jgi:flagellar motor switch protein FliM